MCPEWGQLSSERSLPGNLAGAQKPMSASYWRLELSRATVPGPPAWLPHECAGKTSGQEREPNGRVRRRYNVLNSSRSRLRVEVERALALDDLVDRGYAKCFECSIMPFRSPARLGVIAQHFAV